MKTLTQAEATPGEWNFISQGLLPSFGKTVLVTAHWNSQRFIALANYNEAYGFSVWDEEVDQDEIVSWQYPPAPSKKTHKEEWMSQWEEIEAWVWYHDAVNSRIEEDCCDEYLIKHGPGASEVTIYNTLQEAKEAVWESYQLNQ